MYRLTAATLVIFLFSATFASVQTRKTLGTVDADTIQAMEHQRILAELEEVHQLRERMLQQGKSRYLDCAAHQACSQMQHSLNTSSP